MKVLHEYTKLLEAVDDPSLHHWDLVLAADGHPGVWTAETRREVFSATVELMAELYWRVVEEYMHLPYPLAKLDDDRISNAEKQDIRMNFFHTCWFCRDEGVSDPIHAKLESEADLATPFMVRLTAGKEEK